MFGREFNIVVPEAPPQLTNALRTSPSTTVLAGVLTAALATYALTNTAIKLLKRSDRGASDGLDHAAQQERRALPREVAVALEACQDDSDGTLEAAVALEAELDAVREIMWKRENQLAAVTQVARQQAQGAHQALANSQRQVERLEGLAVALRESLGAHGAAAAMVTGAGHDQRRDLVVRFKELRHQLESAQWHVYTAESRAHDLEQQLGTLVDNSGQLASAMRQLQDAAGQQAALAREAVASAQQIVAVALTHPNASVQHNAALLSEARQQLATARAGVAAAQADIGDMKLGLEAAMVMWQRQQIEQEQQRLKHQEEEELRQLNLTAALKAAQEQADRRERARQQAEQQQRAAAVAAVAATKAAADAAARQQLQEMMTQQRPGEATVPGPRGLQERDVPPAQAGVQPQGQGQGEDKLSVLAQAAGQEQISTEQLVVSRSQEHAQAKVQVQERVEDGAQASVQPQVQQEKQEQQQLGARDQDTTPQAEATVAPVVTAAEAQPSSPDTPPADQAKARNAEVPLAPEKPNPRALPPSPFASAVDMVREKISMVKEQMAAHDRAVQALVWNKPQGHQAPASEVPQQAPQLTPAAGEAGEEARMPSARKGDEPEPREGATSQQQGPWAKVLPRSGEAAVVFVDRGNGGEEAAPTGQEAAVSAAGEEGAQQPSEAATATSDSLVGAAPAASTAEGAGEQESGSGRGAWSGISLPTPPSPPDLDEVMALAQVMLQRITGGGGGTATTGGAAPRAPSPVVTPGEERTLEPEAAERERSTGRTATLQRAMEAGATRAKPGVLMLASAAAMEPSAKKVAEGSTGEDAFFVSVVGCGALGVADGVGGWATEGVDSAAYARTLMVRCQHALEGPHPCSSALAALEYAQATTKLPGSSTACVAMLRPNGMLEVVNVGDSGIRLVRDGRVVWSTHIQEHIWNCPYQLSFPRLVPQSDTTADAAVEWLELQAGDIIVAGTDGLFDNMWEAQLLEVLAVPAGPLDGNNNTNGDGDGRHGWLDPAGAQAQAAVVAQRLVDAASANAQDGRYRGPWAMELEQHGKVGGMALLFGARGGKCDDITAVVSVVC